MDEPDAGLRVLLVEDDESQAQLLTLQMRRLGTRAPLLRHADSLKQAGLRLREEAFDVVLLDLTLPDSWGMDTLREMRALTEEHLPIVVFSGLSDERVRNEALRSGASGFAVKGETTPTDLLFLLHKAAKGR